MSEEDGGRVPTAPGLRGFAPEPPTASQPEALVPSRGADRELIYQALRFYFWAAGEGIFPIDSAAALEPEEGFWQYGLRTGDEDWETVAERYRDSDASLAEDAATRLSPEGVAARAEGIAQPPTKEPTP